MKRIIYSLVAIVSLLAVSCVQEDTSVTQPIGSEALVSIAVGNGSASRAIAQGEYTNELLYAVYDAEWKLLFTRDVELPATLTYKVEEKLLTGYTYHFVFWAQKEGTYTPEWGTVGQVSVPTVTIDYTNVAANDDSRDAFFGQVEVAVQGTTNKSVELKRPFAQINHGTNDLAKAATAGFNTTALKTELKVSAYNTLYLNGGGVDGLTEVTFASAARDTDMTTLNTDYDWISMNYVLWTAEESSLGECTLTITDGAKEIGVKYPQAPARRNYRTNLLGALLTDSANVNVEVKPDTEGDNNVNVPEYENVSNASELQQAIDEGKEHIILTDDIDLNDLLSLFSRAATDTDPKLVINKGNTFTIDLNSKKLSATSSFSANREMFLVKGNLTVVNGTIEYEHTGENMEWNAMTTIFDITDGGVLNLDGVVAKNLGGTDMTFVAHLNNWGEVTLNVENSTLEATYVAVRAFNSGYDMNNITIKNSTLKGGNYAFWVHNYTLVDFGGDEAKTEAHQALLNLDVFNGTNTFVGKNNTPIRYGFTNSLYSGVVTTESELKEILAAGWCVILGNDIVLNESLNTNNTSDAGAVINLNGYKLSGTDNATGSFGLIYNTGNLTVVGPGKLELSATNNRGWNAYSSVISNNPGGNLVVKDGVVIEHLGGTDMAYGIDNLTNGKGTVAVTTIKDATVKSTYRAVRQFLNGIEATNELYVKAGAVIEGANKSIWMQDPSKNANTGKLVVEAGAELKGNVYLSVTAGSTEWPVEVSIAKAALVNGSEVLTSNVPDGYMLTEENGVYSVVTQQANEIWYTSTEMKLEPTTPTAFNANIVSNVWDSTTGKGVIAFDAPLTDIGNEAFRRNTNNTPSNWATSITLPEGLKTIGNYAFYQCFSLTEIVIPDSVTSIGENAFGSCRAATTVTLGSGVTSIASMAFYDLWELGDFICKPTTPPTLADKWVFSSDYKPAKVIVPAASVDAYKAANFWSSLNIVAE